MRLGKVQIIFEYVVDLDNKDMIDYAKESIEEDIVSAIRHDGGIYGDIPFNILNETMDECKFLEESDIPDFLKEENNYE